MTSRKSHTDPCHLFIFRTFCPTKPAKSLHTQKNRQFFFEPENNFWIVMVYPRLLRICLIFTYCLKLGLLNLIVILLNDSLGGSKPNDREAEQRW